MRTLKQLIIITSFILQSMVFTTIIVFVYYLNIDLAIGLIAVTVHELIIVFKEARSSLDNIPIGSCHCLANLQLHFRVRQNAEKHLHRYSIPHPRNKIPCGIGIPPLTKRKIISSSGGFF